MCVTKDLKLAKTNIRIFSDHYLVRTIKPDDASERWASWASDPELVYMMNMSPLTWTTHDIADYIKKYDQRSRLLLGIFERDTWKHIGVIAAEIRHGDQVLGNMFIGDPQYRNKGVITEIVPRLFLRQTRHQDHARNGLGAQSRHDRTSAEDWIHAGPDRQELRQVEV
jgi:RimJ/RimL family protein N-acetyltransferase